MDTGEVPGYEFELPRGPRHRTRQDLLRSFQDDSTRVFPQDSTRSFPQDPTWSFPRDSTPQDPTRSFPQDSLRPLRRPASAMPPPGTAVRAAGGVLAVMRTRNWLVGLVLPIVVAVIVGIAVVVTTGGGGNGGAAPSALAAGFPPARLAGTAFTGPAGTTPVTLAAIAAAAGTEVLAGTAGGAPALWVSTDGGSAWTREALAGTATMTTAGGGQLAGVAHGAAGWLAVGTAPSGGGRGGPLIVSSPDALAWAVTGGAAALGAGSAGAVTAAAAASRQGFVIVGHRAARGGAVTAAAWYAPGLAGWRTAAIAGQAGHGQTLMNAVTATARGFAAVGAAGTRPAAWLSADGRTWRQSVLAKPAGAARAALEYVAAHGTVVVAAGTAFSAAGTGSPFAEASGDSGATWTMIMLPEPAGGRATAVTALTAAGAGFTAAGTYGSGAGSAVVLWTLPAAGGTGWRTATPQGTGLAGPAAGAAAGTATQNALTALTADGATLTGAGYTGQQAGQQPTLWQSPIRY
jgi:hypothetical protein